MRAELLILSLIPLSLPAAALILPGGVEIEDESDILSLVEEGVIDPSTGDRLIRMLNDPIDLLSASPEEMIDIPGIDSQDVERIVELRRRGKLRRIDDLALIGLDPERIELIRRFSRVGRGRSAGWIGLRFFRGWGGEVRAELGGRVTIRSATVGAKIGADRDGCELRFVSAGWIGRRFSVLVGDYSAGGRLDPFRIRPALSGYKRKRGAALIFRSDRLLIFASLAEGAEAAIGSTVAPGLLLGLTILRKESVRPAVWLWRPGALSFEVSQEGMGLEIETRDGIGRAFLSLEGSSLRLLASRRLGRKPRVYVSGYLRGGGGRVYMRAYVSFGTRRLFGGASFYRYLRGAPSVEYASRSFTCWAGTTFGGWVLKLKCNLYRRGGSKPLLRRRLTPELTARLPGRVTVRARIDIGEGWRVMVSRWGGRVSGYAAASDDGMKGRVDLRWGGRSFR